MHSNALWFPALLLLSACNSVGEGTVTVTAYGEAFIEDGIPADAFDDGWAADFQRFEVTIRDITVGGVTLEDADPVKLTRSSSGEGQELGSILVPAGEQTDSSFTIARVDIEGTAWLGSEIKTFHWVFDQAVRYQECETTTSVEAGEDATFQITVHADHLFYDSLVSSDPQLLFQAIADADTDDDDVITEEELEAADLGSYDPGSGGDIDNLWQFLTAQSHTLGHVDGEGHCHADVVD